MQDFLYKFINKDMDEIISAKDIPFYILKGKTVLVTGATGMLAYYFCCVLMHLNIKLNYNIKVLALVRNKEKAIKKFSGFLSSHYFELLVQDICTPICYKKKVDYILHAAGGASPKYIQGDPLGIIKANTLGTMNIIEFARKNEVINILYTSTREVYGKIDGKTEIKELDMGILDHSLSRACYPESKRMAEQILISAEKMYSIPYTIARIAHVYGPGMDIDNDGRVMSDFISDAVHSRDITLNSDGRAERAFCYLSDATIALFLVLLRGEKNSIYNVANEKEPMIIKDIAKLITQLCSQKNIKVVLKPTLDNGSYCDYVRTALDTKKIESIGWSPQVSLSEGIKRTLTTFENKEL